ncbi:MAG: TlpA disulfide reductase family protein [Pirellulaceae bacterium]|nr:TlpA disulfide reductase family protein [Pirellulaceae bacterium]
MKLATAWLCSAVLMSSLTSHLGADPMPAKLNWNNGDQLAGKLLGADRTHLEWEAPVFTQPFQIDLNQLRSVQLQSADQLLDSDESFRFFLQSGDVINGDLIKLSTKQLIIQSKRHGQISLDRKQVRSFRRLNDPAMIFEGPAGLNGWSTISRSRTVDDWKVEPQGVLSTEIVGSELYRDLSLPEIAEIEITLSWKQKPGFLITFVEPGARRVPRQTVKLETWDDELVMQALASTGDFEQVQTLGQDVKRIQLRLIWDQSSGELTAFSRTGELLSKLKADRQVGKKLTCLYIKNKGAHLRLEGLRVRSWNGTALSALAEGQSHIHQLDGIFIYGTTQELRNNELVFVGDQDETLIPLESVSAVDFGESDSDPSNQQPFRVNFTDGTAIGGELLSIDQNRITVQTRYSETPITSSRNGMYSLSWRQNKQVEEIPTDILENRGGRLHGKLAPVGERGLLGWKPTGSRNASPLTSSHPARIIRQTANLESPLEQENDQIYFRNGDVIPGRILSMNEQQIELDPAFAAPTSISRNYVRAIDFGTSEDHIGLPFDQSEWVISNSSKGAINRTADQLVFHQSTTIIHPALPAGNSVSFHATWTEKEPVSLTIGLRTQIGKRPPTPYCKLYFIGEQVHIQDLKRGQSFVYRRRLPDRNAEIEMSLTSKRFKLVINGETTLNEAVGNDRPEILGLMLAVKRERPNGRPTNNLLTISMLKTGNAFRPAGSIAIDDDRKQQILTIPRNRKNNPPTHLLAARNDDLLRGRLVSMNSEQVNFRSRLSDLSFPRERVAIVLWLDPPQNPDQNTAQPAPSNTKLDHPMQAVLNGGVTFSFSADRMSEGHILGTHPFLGQCRIPMKQVREIRIGQHTASEPESPFADWVLTHAPEPRFATTSSTRDNPGQGQISGVDSPLVGTKAKDFQAKLIDGQTFRLSNHSKKILILDFWATWCGPCLRAMPEVMEAAARFPKDKVLLVGVNQQESPKTVRDFLAAKKWNLSVAFDPEGAIAKHFEVEAIPRTVIIGSDGQIKRVYDGANNNLQQEITQTLIELGVESSAKDKF